MLKIFNPFSLCVSTNGAIVTTTASQPSGLSQRCLAAHIHHSVLQEGKERKREEGRKRGRKKWSSPEDRTIIIICSIQQQQQQKNSFYLLGLFIKLLRDYERHIIQSCNTRDKNILISILGLDYLHRTKCGCIKTAKLSTSPATPTIHIPSVYWEKMKGFFFIFYSPLYPSTSTLSSSPFPALFQFNYSWLFPIPSCRRDVHLSNKDTLALYAQEKRRDERQNIHEISNLHENKPHRSARKKVDWNEDLPGAW